MIYYNLNSQTNFLLIYLVKICNILKTKNKNKLIDVFFYVCVNCILMLNWSGRYPI